MTVPGFLTASLIVAVGGAIGAWLRYATGVAFARAIGPVAASTFPWATLTVNVLGSFAMGLLAGWLALTSGGSADGGESWRLLLGVGILGGFTTFSAFSLEIVLLAQRGAIGLAALYATASLVGGIAGLLAGLSLMRGAA